MCNKKIQKTKIFEFYSTKLTSYIIRWLCFNCRTVLLGKDTRKNKIYRIFWSTIDNNSLTYNNCVRSFWCISIINKCVRLNMNSINQSLVTELIIEYRNVASNKNISKIFIGLRWNVFSYKMLHCLTIHRTCGDSDK